MTETPQLAVGEPWPYPMHHQGLGINASIAPDGMDLLLMVTIDRPTRKEIDALRSGPLRIGLMPSPPLVWLVLSGNGISFDTAFAPGLAGSTMTPEHYAAAAKAHEWRKELRRLLMLGVADTSSATPRCCAVYPSGTWWRKWADYCAEAHQPVNHAQWQAAQQRDYRRWPTTNALLKSCPIVEKAGSI